MSYFSYVLWLGELSVAQRRVILAESQISFLGPIGYSARVYFNRCNDYRDLLP